MSTAEYSFPPTSSASPPFPQLMTTITSITPTTQQTQHIHFNKNMMFHFRPSWRFHRNISFQKHKEEWQQNLKHLGQANLIRRIACSPPWILKDFEKKIKLRHLNWKSSKMSQFIQKCIKIFFCVSGGGGVTMWCRIIQYSIVNVHLNPSLKCL